MRGLGEGIVKKHKELYRLIKGFMQILLAVLACYLTLSAVVNLYRHISVKNKPVEDLSKTTQNLR